MCNSRCSTSFKNTYNIKVFQIKPHLERWSSQRFALRYTHPLDVPTSCMWRILMRHPFYTLRFNDLAAEVNVHENLPIFLSNFCKNYNLLQLVPCGMGSLFLILLLHSFLSSTSFSQSLFPQILLYIVPSSSSPPPLPPAFGTLSLQHASIHNSHNVSKPLQTPFFHSEQYIKYS